MTQPDSPLLEERRVEAAAAAIAANEPGCDIFPECVTIGTVGCACRKDARAALAAADALGASSQDAAPGLRAIAEEFVSVTRGFPDKPLGPKTKQRFCDAFAAALGAPRSGTEGA